jgi:hypothetical protein
VLGNAGEISHFSKMYQNSSIQNNAELAIGLVFKIIDLALTTNYPEIVSISLRLQGVFSSIFCLIGIFFARAECVPAKTFIETKDSGGEFLRVSPNGNKLIFGDLAQSSQNRTVLLDITKQDDRPEYSISRVRTPFNDETYPVDTLSDEWTLIASPNHDGKMRYYELGEVQKNGGNAKPVFEDYYPSNLQTQDELVPAEK